MLRVKIFLKRFFVRGALLTILSQDLIRNLQLNEKALYFNNYDPGRILKKHEIRQMAETRD